MRRRRPTLEQQRAALQLAGLASPRRLRVVTDPEGFPIIPGRYGQIEWYCDGTQCWSCALPGQPTLAVYTDRPRLFERLGAVPGVKRHQTGATEMRAVFPSETLDQVAAAIKARHKRALSADEARWRGFKRTPSTTSGR